MRLCSCGAHATTIIKDRHYCAQCASDKLSAKTGWAVMLNPKVIKRWIIGEGLESYEVVEREGTLDHPDDHPDDQVFWPINGEDAAECHYATREEAVAAAVSWIDADLTYNRGLIASCERKIKWLEAARKRLVEEQG